MVAVVPVAPISAKELRTTAIPTMRPIQIGSMPASTIIIRSGMPTSSPKLVGGLMLVELLVVIVKARAKDEVTASAVMVGIVPTKPAWIIFQLIHLQEAKVARVKEKARILLDFDVISVDQQITC